MKCLSILTVFCLVFLTSCNRDSPDQWVSDKIGFLEEFNRIMEDVAEGKISSNEGSTQLEELRQKGDELQKRIQYLRKEENSEEALRAAEEKHQERKRKATLGYISAKNKLIQSGNVTQDLQQALEKIK